MKNLSKQVSFGSTTLTADPQHSLTLEERKSLCWYSESELAHCREDARQAIEALHEVGGDLNAIDESKICLRGIEKYGDVVGKLTSQRKLIESILSQQTANRAKNNENNNECPNSSSGQEHLLAVISKVLSQPSIEIAKIYAANNARQALQEYSSIIVDTSKTSSCATDKSNLNLLVEVVDASSTQLGTKRRREPCCNEISELDRRNVKHVRQSSE